MTPFVIAAETASVLGWWTVYKGTEQAIYVHNGNSSKSPTTTTIAGAVAGLVPAATSLFVHGARSFPETLVELKVSPPGRNPMMALIKGSVCHAAFFCVYEGLRTSIHKRLDQDRISNKIDSTKDKTDRIKIAVNVAAAAIAAVAYRAAGIPLYSGPLANPLLRPGGPGILSGTVAVMSVTTAAMQAATDYVFSNPITHDGSDMESSGKNQLQA